MKTVEFVVIFALSIHFAYSSSIISVYNEAVDAVAEGAAETEGKPPVLSGEKTLPLGMFDLANEMSSEDSRCTAGNCTEDCRKQGYVRGVCIGKRCRCWIRKPSRADLIEDDEEEIESRAVRSCNPSVCAQTCRRLGFPRSRCASGRCICSR